MRMREHAYGIWQYLRVGLAICVILFVVGCLAQDMINHLVFR